MKLIFISSLHQLPQRRVALKVTQDMYITLQANLSFGLQDILVLCAHHGTEVHHFELSVIENKNILLLHLTLNT